MSHSLGPLTNLGSIAPIGTIGTSTDKQPIAPFKLNASSTLINLFSRTANSPKQLGRGLNSTVLSDQSSNPVTRVGEKTAEISSVMERGAFPAPVKRPVKRATVQSTVQPPAAPVIQATVQSTVQAPVAPVKQAIEQSTVQPPTDPVEQSSVQAPAAPKPGQDNNQPVAVPIEEKNLLQRIGSSVFNALARLASNVGGFFSRSALSIQRIWTGLVN